MTTRRSGCMALLITVCALGAGTVRAEPFVYVANLADDTVSVIDTLTNGVIETIPVGAFPQFIAISPDGTRGYVSNFNDSTISVIDTATNTVIDTIGSGAGPHLSMPNMAVLTPDGSRIYVANHGNDTVAVIDAVTNSFIGEPIDVLHTPVWLAMHPNGSRVYVVDINNDVIVVIDTASDILSHLVNVGPGPGQIVIRPDGTYAYVSRSAGTIEVINTTSRTVVETIDVGESEPRLALTPDGSRLYAIFREDPGTIVTIDTATNAIIGEPISVERDPVSIAAGPTPYGMRLYVAHLSDGAVSVIDPVTNGVIGEPIAVGQVPISVAFGPGPDVTAVTSDPMSPLTVYAGTDGAGVLLSTDGGASWTLANSGLTDFHVTALAIASDGSAVYAGTEAGGVFRTLDGGASWEATNAGLGHLHVRALHILPGNDRVLYAGLGDGGGVYKSTDGGATWEAADDLLL